jgi:hypothetical protein
METKPRPKRPRRPTTRCTKCKAKSDRRYCATCAYQLSVSDVENPYHPGRAPKPVAKRLGDLVCPLCKGREFVSERGRMDSRWGITSHKMTLMICLHCSLVLSFSGGRSIFDFD